MEFYDRSEERTGVQTADPWSPAVDVQCDYVMCYGIGDSMKERIQSFKEKGYVVHLMTGVSWGNYKKFLDGEFDGRRHWDEGQVDQNGNDRIHGKDVPYMSPSVAFASYLTEHLKQAIDAGVEAIHLEEPEFWADCGYSEGFKREWQIFYNEPWRDPMSSPDAQFRASKLKSYLYKRTLDRLCCELKEYALTTYGRNVRFYVPTHSLVNYSQWKIVSPESSLIDIPAVDGYIAQIWTGTSRTENVYEGKLKERTFETAFLEYGVMQELTRGTGRRMWFLHDPIEDSPRYTWKEYRQDYYRTVTASLFHYHVHHFEVCPWPNRVLLGKYPRGEQGKPIPPEYATNLLTVIHTLRNMKQDDCRFDQAAPEIGVLLADSGMFQRMYPQNTPEAQNPDPLMDLTHWTPFYGLALPLLKQGLAVRPVQLDNIRRFVSYLDSYKALVLSYEFMKPEYPDIHNALSQWVKNGGLLIYAGDGSDSFHNIRSWWKDYGYDNPAQHLFECCGLEKRPAPGLHKVEKGLVYVIPSHPASFAVDKAGADCYRAAVKEALAAAGTQWNKSASLVLRRGPYAVTAVMDESVQQEPVTLTGTYVDVYDHKLSVVRDPKLAVGSVGLYYDVDKIDRQKPADILAAAARVEDFKAGTDGCSFTATGPEGIVCAVRIALCKPPKEVTARRGAAEISILGEYDEATQTALLEFDNSPDGVQVDIRF